MSFRTGAMIDKIGRYEVKAELGRGGFGRVYRAWDPTVGRMVAIKTLSAGGDQELLVRFRNEAAAAGKLRHKNIIVIHDYGEESGEPYIVMELLDGDDLQRVLQSNRPLSLLQRIQIMDKVAEGLDHAHRNGVVHRDVKPANIMILPDLNVKIMDFGIALVTQLAGTRVTKAGTVPGTLKYMAPEQFRGATNDPLSDIFSLGTTYYEFITGIHPFDGPAPGAIVYNIGSIEPKPIRELCPECPEALEQVIVRCLTKEREFRYQSIDDLRFDMRPIVAELQHDHAEGLLVEAIRLSEARQHESAMTVLREVADLDPANRKARQLREKVQANLQRETVRPRVDALMRQGRQLLAERQFKEAIDALESALRLDKSNLELTALLREAQAVRQRSLAAEKLIAEARVALRQQDLTGAYHRASEAAKHDPYNPSAEQVLQQVRDEIYAVEAERQRLDQMARARGAMLAGAFYEALQTLERLREQHPNSSEVQTLYEQCEREKEESERREQIAAGTSLARQYLKDGRLGTAVNSLEELIEIYPDEAQVRDLLTYARNELKLKKHQEHIERLMREVDALVDAGNIDGALQMLEKGRVYYPGDRTINRRLESVRETQNALAREQALTEALTIGELLCGEGRFGEAQETLQSFASSFGNEPRIEEMQRRIEREADERRRTESIRALCSEMKRLLDQSDFATAISIAEAALARYTGEAELKDLLHRAQDGLRIQRRTEAVNQLVHEVSELTSTHLFDRALDVLEKGIQSYPGEPDLDEARRQALQKKSQFERESALTATTVEARAHLQRREPERALTTCETFVRTHGNDDAIQSLLADARQQIRAREERAAAIATALEQSTQQLDAKDFTGVIQILEQGARDYPEEPRFKQLLKQVIHQKETEELEQGVRAAVNDASALLAGLDWDSAIARTELGIKQFGKDQRLTKLKKRIQQEREADRERRSAQRASGIARVFQEAESLRREGKCQEALNAIAVGVRAYGPEPRLEVLGEQIRVELDGQKRAQAQRDAAITTILTKAGQMLAHNDYDAVLALVDQALQSYPGESRLLQCHDRVAYEKSAFLDRAKIDRASAEEEFWLRSQQSGQTEESFTDLFRTPEQQPRKAADAQYPELAESFSAEPYRQPAEPQYEPGAGENVQPDSDPGSSQRNPFAGTAQYETPEEVPETDEVIGSPRPARSRIFLIAGMAAVVALAIAGGVAWRSRIKPAEIPVGPTTGPTADPVWTMREKETAAWAKIRINDLVSLRQYLAVFASGAHAIDARSRIDFLEREETAWNAIKGSNDPAALEAFLKEFVGGRYDGIARRAQAESAGEEKTWLEALRSRQPLAIDTYTEIFPKGKHVAEARRLLTDLENEQWRKVLAAKDTGQLEAFLSDFPKSNRNLEAQGLIVTWRWERIKANPVVSELIDFRGRFPGSRFDEEASKLVDSLRDDEEWLRIRNSTVAADFHRHLNTFKTCKHRNEGDEAIRKIEEATRPIPAPPRPTPTPEQSTTPTPTPTPTPTAAPTPPPRVPPFVSGAPIRKKDGLTYVAVPAGSFRMGCIEGDRKCGGAEMRQPLQRTVNSFHVSQTEVTVEAYLLFTKEQNLGLPPESAFNKKWQNLKYPITNVTVAEATGYCQWIEARLPTETEWEYAARSGRADSLFVSGNQFVAAFSNITQALRAVGSTPNRFGISDMTGNVSEVAIAEAVAGRVALRGGNFAHGPDQMRISYRELRDAKGRLGNATGFRCVF